MGKTIKFLGTKKDTEYNGTDHGDGNAPVKLQRNEELEVSDVKAAQVAEDFPHLFLVDGKKPPTPKGAPKPPPAEDDENDDDDGPNEGDENGDEAKAALLALDTADLKARAEKLGIDGVGKGNLKSKTAIADAILAKLAETTKETPED